MSIVNWRLKVKLFRYDGEVPGPDARFRTAPIMAGSLSAVIRALKSIPNHELFRYAIVTNDESELTAEQMRELMSRDDIPEPWTEAELAWDNERVGVKDGCLLFMAMDGNIDVAGAVDAEMLGGGDPVAAYRATQPALQRAVAGAYRMGEFEEVWDAPGILRHRRVLVRIG